MSVEPGPPGGVSRETPPPPPAATLLFGEAVQEARAFAELLVTAGVDRGLIGPRESPRIWDRHLLNSAAIAPLVPRDSAVVDVGSGAGLPGVPLALARRDLSVTLVEPMARRVAFLEEVVAHLHLAPRVEVVRARADELGDRRWDVATARAVAPLDRLARWTLPLVRAGGRLLAVKGSSADAELAAAVQTLRRLGADRWDVHQVGTGVLPVPTTVIEVVQGTPQRRGAARQKERR